MPNWVSLRSALWLAGVLAIGALGNGVWEFVVKPAGSWLLTGMLSLSTLGISSARDSMYLQVARGHTEAAAISLFSLMAGVIGGVSTGAMVGALRTMRARERKTEQPSSIAKKRSARPVFFVLTAGSVVAVVFSVQSFRLAYINTTIARLDQMQRIIAPYTPESARIVFAARIASMQSRADYDAVVSDMEAIARANRAQLSPFTPPI